MNDVGANVTASNQLSAGQWKSGLAAWLGWTFDGLDMHLYTLVAAPFVAELLAVSDTRDPRVGAWSAWIQAAFLVGWALGGGFFGRVGDLLGRGRALSLTILTYALFTGLSYFAQNCWQLLLLRFIAALGIGGEWAVGASLLAETWPRSWRPWIAAVLQTGVNVGILLAALSNYLLADFPPRTVFLVGVLPALLVFWIRREVPETQEWIEARSALASGSSDPKSTVRMPGLRDLFQPPTRSLTLRIILVCGLGLTAHWAFMFWYQQHLRNLPGVFAWSASRKNELISLAMTLVIIASTLGNFFAAWLARRIGYRATISSMCAAYGLTLMAAYATPRDLGELLILLPAAAFFQGLFSLFTMYLPPLFPTLLRTTGAGFCYNIGRLLAAVGTVLFTLIARVGDYRIALFWTGALFLPTALLACRLPGPQVESNADARTSPLPLEPVD